MVEHEHHRPGREVVRALDLDLDAGERKHTMLIMAVLILSLAVACLWILRRRAI
jgi:hypothetical protein